MSRFRQDSKRRSNHEDHEGHEGYPKAPQMQKKTSAESRRKFLKAVPAAVAGAVATKAIAQGPPQVAGPIKPETLDCAEKIAGLDFMSEEEAAVTGAVNNRLRRF